MTMRDWIGRCLGWSVVLAGVGTISACTSPGPFGTVDAVAQLPPAEPLDAEDETRLRAEALAFLLELTESPYALYRANAIEALQADPEHGEAAARHGLIDDNLGVRFAAAMAVGIHRHEPAVPLVHALLQDPDESVRAAAILALNRNGQRASVAPLASMLRSTDLRVRSNAALVLGELDDPSAIPMLHEALTYDAPRASLAQLRIAELQIAEAMVKLGDESGIERIRTALYRRDPAQEEVTALAATMLGRLRDFRSKPDLINLVAMWKEYRRSAEVRLAAMGSLAQLGSPPDLELVLEYLTAEFEMSGAANVPAIQAQAAFVLGEIGSPEALAHLARLFRESGSELVRLQAAAAILKRIPGGTVARGEAKP